MSTLTVKEVDRKKSVKSPCFSGGSNPSFPRSKARTIPPVHRPFRAVFPHEYPFQSHHFFGTTNTYDFLKDMTGNRRFWPVDVEPERAKKDLWTDFTDEEVRQVWAEAVCLFRQNEKIHIDDRELKRMAEEAQDRHLEESPLAGAVKGYLDRLLPEDWETMDLSARPQARSGGFPSCPSGSHRYSWYRKTRTDVYVFPHDGRMPPGKHLHSLQ